MSKSIFLKIVLCASMVSSTALGISDTSATVLVFTAAVTGFVLGTRKGSAGNKQEVADLKRQGAVVKEERNECHRTLSAMRRALAQTKKDLKEARTSRVQKWMEEWRHGE